VSPIINRRNALIGWAMWKVWRYRAKRRAQRVLGGYSPPTRWLRRLGLLVGVALTALGLAAVLRKLRGGGEDEWTALEPLDVETMSEPAPLSSVEPDDDIPPAA
jgi:hypothetical protein